ncbi:MAG TPA: MATE family efflux transporter [Chloroflexi bacterium]|nr:MATE family efflux transporter [Chloroflexota bacterium]
MSATVDRGQVSRSLRRTLLGDAEARSIRAEVFRLALPSIGEQLLNMTVGMVDTYLMGHISAVALTGVGLSNNMVMLVQTFVMAVATGTTAVVARLIGAREPETASRVVQQSLMLGATIGAVLTTLLSIFAVPALRFYRPEPDVLVIGSTYMRIVAMSFVMQGILWVGTASLRGAGDTRTPLFLMLGVNALNIVTSLLFLYGLGPIPAIGVYGPAVGTAVSMAAGGVVMLVILARGRCGLRLPRTGWRPDTSLILRVTNVGLPAAGEQLAMRLGLVMFQRSVAGLGTVAYAAHSVASTGMSISFMPGFGFAVASTTLVGQSLGAKDPERARRTVREAFRVASLAMGMAGLLLVLFSRQVMSIFVNDPAVIVLGITPLQILGMVQPISAVSMVYSGSLRGAGDTRWTLIITALTMWVLRVPLTMLLVGPLGLAGAWLAMATDNVTRALLFWLRYRTGRWTKIKV